jgi:hypothetical protein
MVLELFHENNRADILIIKFFLNDFYILLMCFNSLVLQCCLKPGHYELPEVTSITLYPRLQITDQSDSKVIASGNQSSNSKSNADSADLTAKSLPHFTDFIGNDVKFGIFISFLVFIIFVLMVVMPRVCCGHRYCYYW